MKSIPLYAVLVLGALSASSALGAQDPGPRPRTIDVTGTAEVKIAPDEAVLILSVDSRDRDLAVAKSQHDAHVKKLIAAAQEFGIESKHIRTSELTMGPEYSEERIPKFLGFLVSQTLVLELTDLKKYEGLMTRVLQAGVNRVQSVSFIVADATTYRAEARAKAIRAAREKATAMAAELGQKIGRPYEIFETPESPWAYAQANASVQNAFIAALPDQAPSVATGEVNIHVSVRVVFELE